MATTCDHTRFARTWTVPSGYVLVERSCTECGSVLEAYVDAERDEPPVVRAVAGVLAQGTAKQ